MKTYLKTLPIALTLTAGSALAGNATPPSFSTLDKNDDRVLSLDEIEHAYPKLGVVDANFDGFPSKTEVEKAVPGLMFEDAGADGDDPTIGREEYQRIVRHMEKQKEETS